MAVSKHHDRRLIVFETRRRWEPFLRSCLVAQGVEVRSARNRPYCLQLVQRSPRGVLVVELTDEPAGAWTAALETLDAARQSARGVWAVAVADARLAHLEWTAFEFGARDFLLDCEALHWLPQRVLESLIR